MKKLHHVSHVANTSHISCEHVSHAICCKHMLSEQHREVYYDKYTEGINFKSERVGQKYLIKAV